MPTYNLPDFPVTSSTPSGWSGTLAKGVIGFETDTGKYKCGDGVVASASLPYVDMFIWSRHTFSTDYPDSGFKVQFGNSYEYAEGSPAPDQRGFTLSFPYMAYYLNPNGSINPIGNETPIEPTTNMKLLEDFYNSHKLWKTFVYPHPVYGGVVVKFKKPLRIPAGIPGGGGAIGAFSIELLELP